MTGASSPPFPRGKGEKCGESTQAFLTYILTHVKEIAMKKTLLAVLMVLLWTVSSVFAADLKVGDNAAGFKLKDPAGVEYSLDSPQYKGKVVVVFYADPGSKDLNNELQNALKAAREAGKIDKAVYEGLGVVNVKDSIVPNFVLRSIIKSKQEETKATILIDPDYSLLNLWGLTKKTSNIILLDKERVCRYIYKGKVPAADIAKVIALVQEYQVK
jgi:predicted transcriptional regulator